MTDLPVPSYNAEPREWFLRRESWYTLAGGYKMLVLKTRAMDSMDAVLRMFPKCLPRMRRTRECFEAWRMNDWSGLLEDLNVRRGPESGYLFPIIRMKKWVNIGADLLWETTHWVRGLRLCFKLQQVLLVKVVSSAGRSCLRHSEGVRSRRKLSPLRITENVSICQGTSTNPEP